MTHIEKENQKESRQKVKRDVPKKPETPVDGANLEEYPEVAEFLQDLNLLKYVRTFVENGIEDLETILELQEEHLSMMKIPLGHKLKIVKKINESKPEVEETKQENRP